MISSKKPNAAWTYSTARYALSLIILLGAYHFIKIESPSELVELLLMGLLVPLFLIGEKIVGRISDQNAYRVGWSLLFAGIMGVVLQIAWIRTSSGTSPNTPFLTAWMLSCGLMFFGGLLLRRGLEERDQKFRRRRFGRRKKDLGEPLKKLRPL